MPARLQEFRLSLPEAPDILKRWYANGKLGGLVLDGLPNQVLGTPCRIRVEVGNPAPRHLFVRGTISWIRHATNPPLPECFGVDFIDDDANGRERLLEFASACDADAVRFETRASVKWPLTLEHEGRASKEEMADLSLGGLFVKTGAPLPVGTAVKVAIRPPLSLRALQITGKVAWVRNTGAPKGMGIQFDYVNARDGERLQKLIAKLGESAPDA